MLRKLAPAVLFFIGSTISPLAAQTLADEGLLWQDPTFQRRVEAAVLSAAISITNEGSGIANHASRDTLAVTVLSDQSGAWQRFFAAAVASQGAVATLADAAGATPLVANATTCTAATPPVCTTTGNLSVQAALVTDAAINNAISSIWNSFFTH